jgi:SAM-dependent methyltransferase
VDVGRRFEGFAELYDTNRPQPPADLGGLLCRYAGVERPDVVDLGSGSGLSTRWAATWAASVVGVEPEPDMRAHAVERGGDRVRYVDGRSDRTGLPDACADVVLAVQAMHWMEPEPTLAEVVRLLRPGGVFATVDADWPPTAGAPGAELAWGVLHARMRVIEARIARGEPRDDVARAIDADDPELADENLSDPHRNRSLPGGLRSWSKRDHLRNIERSGRFGYARELVMHAEVPCDDAAARFVAVMRSQGSYQGLRRAGLTDAEIGADTFEHAVRTAFESRAPAPTSLAFSWRIRLGVVAR